MSWLMMFGPYFLTIAILVMLHVMDRRSLRVAFNGPTKRQPPTTGKEGRAA